MSGSPGNNPDDPLIDALAAYDDRLAAGVARLAEEVDQAVDPALLPDLSRLTAFLSLLEKAWPRRGQSPDEPTSTDAGSRPQPPATEEVSTTSHSAPGAEDVLRFDRFQIIRTLGQGGFGIVFLAWDPVLRRQVALKVPQPELLMTPESRKRFQREAHAAAALDHPNIVPVYESSGLDTIAYIAAAYIPGPTLSLWLSRQTRPVPAHDAAKLVATLARAIEHAHERGVLHRDLKPSNVLLQQRPGLEAEPDRGENGPLADFEPRITDFSLAKLADGLGPDTRSGVPFGSPPYMAPEQAEGKLTKIGPPADVYGLGCILYELLTRDTPFCGETQLDTLRHVIADDPLPPRRRRPDLTVELEAIVLKCLEKDPGRRYPSARELADDLNRFLAGEPIRARPPSPWKKLRRKARRHPAALAVIALLALFVGTLLGARSWFEGRLVTSRESAQRLQSEVRDRELAARRAQYVADIRQIPRYIQNHRTALADELLLRHRPRPGEDDIRSFAWYYLWRGNHSERRTLTGHRGDVYYVEFSPRGDLLASAGKDGNVLIWDISSWQLYRKIVATQTGVNVAAFTPDGKTIATLDDEGKLKLWEIATGHCQLDRLAHSPSAVVARFTSDGKTIVTGGRNDGLVKVWDRTTGDMLDSFRPGKPNLENVIFSPDGSCLATAGSGPLKLWKWPGRTLIGELSESKGNQGVAFSHDGKRLATAHEGDKAVRVWDLASRRLVREFPGHTEGVFSVAFSADDRTILSASADETIRLWDVATGKERGAHVGHSGRVWNLALSPDGRTIASAGADGKVKLWDLEPPRDGFRLPIPEPANLEFSPDGRTLMVFELGPQWSISRWNVHSGLLLDRQPLNVTGSNGASAFSHDGRLLAIPTESDTIALCDLETGHRQRLHDPAFGELDGLEFSPGDRYLLLNRSHLRPQFLVWDLASRRMMPVPWDPAGETFWTPSEEVLTNLGDRLGWWNPRTEQKKTVSLEPHRTSKHQTMSTDGRLLAAVDPYRRTIHLWSTETLKLVMEFPGHRDGQHILAFSPDRSTLASSGADQTVKLWDVSTGEELLTLEGYTGPTWFLRFSPDGKALATISQTGPNKPSEIRLWLATEDESEPDQSAHRTAGALGGPHTAWRRSAPPYKTSRLHVVGRR
jgi:eukaryotic-like serine/threonine-protein kinase